MLEQLIRKNIKQLIPYSSARDEFQGEATVLLDANENPYSSAFNRYPDSKQKGLKEKIASLKNVRASEIFLGNGSDEAIDLLIRAFCEPSENSILITEPTYGMYSVCADINGVAIQRTQLKADFLLDLDQIIRSITPSTKIIFLCSPNNPSGNLLERKKVEQIIQTFKGLVVVDEAYIDFANDPGFVPSLQQYPNLVILQTLSKAWGLAGLRLGICLASAEIIQVLNKIKYPYNLNTMTQQLVYKALFDTTKKEVHVKTILREREKLKEELTKSQLVDHVFPSDANFLLVKMKDAKAIYQSLLQQSIVVRDRSSVTGCDNCLRITIGTPEENQLFLNALKTI
jgi:histidinol-phosphate aminotransferase